MSEWAWVLITEDGVTQYPGVGPHAAYAAVGVDGDDVTGGRPYLLELSSQSSRASAIGGSPPAS
jgi:hypothetical protein